MLAFLSFALEIRARLLIAKTYDPDTNGVGRLVTVQDSTGQTSYCS